MFFISSRHDNILCLLLLFLFLLHYCDDLLLHDSRLSLYRTHYCTGRPVGKYNEWIKRLFSAFQECQSGIVGRLDHLLYHKQQSESVSHSSQSCSLDHTTSFPIPIPIPFLQCHVRYLILKFNDEWWSMNILCSLFQFQVPPLLFSVFCLFDRPTPDTRQSPATVINTRGTDCTVLVVPYIGNGTLEKLREDNDKTRL